jgi:hypothetical protein
MPVKNQTRYWVLALTCLISVWPGRHQIAEAQFLEPGTTVLQTFSGAGLGDQFGWVADSLGDITGDGIQDLVITAPLNDTGGADIGRVYVYNGATGALVFPALVGPLAGGRYGDAVRPAGDVNGDSVGDIIVGAQAYLSNRGLVRVHSGVDGSVIHTWQSFTIGDQFGFAVASLGDITGDGLSELIIGAMRDDTAGLDAGRVFVYSGAAGGPLLKSINGLSARDRFGSAVASVGDINGDGKNDFVVGAEAYAPGAPAGTGQAYIYSGAAMLLPGTPAPLYTLNPGGPAAAFGQYFADGRSDIDNDGTFDAYVSDYNVNRAYVYSGANGSLIRTFIGDGNGGFGIGRMAGDVDQDGWGDMVLAAWISNAGATQGGKAFVYSGRTSGVLQTYTHNVAFAQLGFDANAMGDVNGDGKTDYLLTAAGDSSNTGKAYLVAGNVVPYSKADIDLDYDVDAMDVTEFVEVLMGAPLDPLHTIRSDVDEDGNINGLDIAAYVAAI